MEDKNTDKNELDEKMHMKQTLVVFLQKYDGNFSKIIHAISSKEKLTEKEINN